MVAQDQEIAVTVAVCVGSENPDDCANHGHQGQVELLRFGKEPLGASIPHVLEQHVFLKLADQEIESAVTVPIDDMGRCVTTDLSDQNLGFDDRFFPMLSTTAEIVVAKHVVYDQVHVSITVEVSCNQRGPWTLHRVKVKLLRSGAPDGHQFSLRRTNPHPRGVEGNVVPGAGILVEPDIAPVVSEQDVFARVFVEVHGDREFPVVSAPGAMVNHLALGQKRFHGREFPRQLIHCAKGECVALYQIRNTITVPVGQLGGIRKRIIAPGHLERLVAAGVELWPAGGPDVLKQVD